MRFLFLILAINFSTLKISAQQIDSLYNPKHNIIQLALLLDVSNSMDGLIDQAKAELWNVVSEVAKAKKNGHSARLEIALYEYGRSTNDPIKGYIKKHLDYSDDLDTISKVLFGLKTNGGEEYCGWVINDAIEELQWRENDSIYRVIFIAGNEEFNQGKVNFNMSCQKGKEKDIFINTIFCGDSMSGVRTFWRDGALTGNGQYFYINSNLRNYDIPTPFDSLINLYGDSINTTYWHFGVSGADKKSNQKEQDANALKMSSSVAVKRNMAKTKKSVYNNSSWDVVDANSRDSNWLAKAKDESLPTYMRGKTLAQKKHIVDSLTTARSLISAKINDLSAKRSKFISDNMKNTNSEKTLGVALVEAIRRQAGYKGFEFSE